MRLFILVFALFLCVLPLSAKEARSIVCNFDGDNAGRIYSIRMAPGMGTTFQLPDGWEIAEFVVSDTKFFFGQSNGKIATVKPLAPDKETSVILYSTNDKLFCFHAVSAGDSAEVDLLVKIELHDEMFFKQRVQQEAGRLVREQASQLETRTQQKVDDALDKSRRDLIFSINTNYTVKNNAFQVDKVSDDGVFTYIRLARSQERPGVFIASRDKVKEFEPVKYTDEGDFYRIHKILAAAGEQFYLKLGDTISEIRRD